MKSKELKWAVVGAGPAGIATVGSLIDNGVSADQIIWIDPHFKVGDLGQHWSEVSSNTTVALFKNFLAHCNSFNYVNRKHQFELDLLPSSNTCKLLSVVEPLQYVTNELIKLVHTLSSRVEKARIYNELWHLELSNSEIVMVKNVVFATGAVPKIMNTPENVEVISLYDALTPHKLKQKCNNEDTVAVFGSSHSAVILLQKLLKIGIKRVVNFYLEPIRFAVPMDGWVLFDNTGLKGDTALWARENLNGKPPENLSMIFSSQENINRYLPQCNKVIYAIGFAKRVPVIEQYPDFKYNPYNGIIVPGLFGIGIGFPEIKADPYGNAELSVGLWKFMDYLNRVLPIWLKYGL